MSWWPWWVWYGLGALSVPAGFMLGVIGIVWFANYGGEDGRITKQMNRDAKRARDDLDLWKKQHIL